MGYLYVGHKILSRVREVTGLRQTGNWWFWKDSLTFTRKEGRGTKGTEPYSLFNYQGEIEKELKNL